MPQIAGINYDRRGSGPPLLLVHGIGSRWQVWNAVIDRLAEERDVIAVDLPGFGRSPRPAEGTIPGIPTFCNFLETFLGELDISKPHVAGNSMGGWIALELARRGTVSSAVGISPAGFAPKRDLAVTVPLLSVLKGTAKASRGLAPLLSRSALGRTAGLATVIAHPDRVEPADSVLTLQGLADATWFWPNLWALARSSFGDGSGIEVPVTIVWGNRDLILFPHQAAIALEAIPRAAFVSMPDCGHVPMFDEPETTAQAILKGTAVTSLAVAA